MSKGTDGYDNYDGKTVRSFSYHSSWLIDDKGHHRNRMTVCSSSVLLVLKLSDSSFRMIWKLEKLVEEYI